MRNFLQNFLHTIQCYRKNIFLIFLSGATLTTGIFWGYDYLQKYVFSDHLQVVFLQIDRGDSIYINTPHHKEIMIDGGYNISTLVSLEKHRPFWDKHLDLLILTHSDSDHYLGFLDILDRFSVGNILMTGSTKYSPPFQKLLKKISEKNIPIIYADQYKDFVVDGVTFDIISPLSSRVGEKSKGNNESLVIKMQYHQQSILFTGDIEQKTEALLLASGKNVHADILKVPHHGSRSSSSENFLRAVNPQQAVFTTGTKNQFGHPHKEVLERYTAFNMPFQNSKDGDVIREW